MYVTNRSTIMKVSLCILGVLLAVVYVQCDADVIPEFKKMLDACAKESGVSETYIPANFDDPKVKCVFACAMKKDGLMVNGKITMEKEMKFLSKHLAVADYSIKKKLTDCANEANQKTEECEIAGTMMKCNLNN